jgi:tRNA nucleotidyltransferase (CCA-adding enzyme)
MRIFQVGGAVRDELLGLPVTDRDFVVVGATPQELEAQGFRPVGKDFPVFLHPQTHEEYALARTERKSGRGYKGFTVHSSPDVTLEEDLARRDLTINAIAKDAAGRYIDPYGGERDLRAGVLRHVSGAFVEDPVRLLRVARFAARFRFAVAPETLVLMREMVANGEVDALVPERVWQEISRGLMERDPVRMLEVLEQCGAMVRVLPEWHAVVAARARAALARAALAGLPLAARFALLLAGASEDATHAACERWRVPVDCAELAMLLSRYGQSIARSDALDATAIVSLLQQVDLFRRSERFALLLETVRALDDDNVDATESGIDRIARAAAAAQAVDAGRVAQAHRGNEAHAVRAARIAAIASALSS